MSRQERKRLRKTSILERQKLKQEARKQKRHSTWNELMDDLDKKNKQEIKRLPNITEVMQQRQRFTSDWNKLKEFENILVFVYDDFQQNGSFNKAFTDCHYMGEAVTVMDNFTLKRDDETGTRIALQKSTGTYFSGKLCGEVYAVPPHIIQQLDEFKGEGYVRISTYVFLTDQTYPSILTSENKNFHPSVKTFMYLGVESMWPDVLYQEPLHRQGHNREKAFFNYKPKALNILDTFPQVKAARGEPLLEYGFGFGAYGSNSDYDIH